MTFVITQRCVGIKDTSCMEVCPVDAISPGLDDDAFEAVDHLFIDPVACIDCGACMPACPSDAIFPEDEVPEEWESYIEINAQYFQNSTKEPQG